VRRLRVLPILLVLVVGAACSGDDGGADRSTSTPSTTSATEAVDPAVEGLPGAEGIAPDPDGTDPLPPLPDDVARPIVFVHGFAGSAQQFESQAMRFVANGYPEERIVAYDHDGAGMDIAGYAEGLDQVVDDALAAAGAEQVYLVGHSRGTFVASTYLDDPDRAAKVARYVALDGAPCPDAVPCEAVTQVTNPGQSHVEVATSAETFDAMYEFLVGESPEVTEIVPQRAPVVLSGRAVEFPANVGRDGATLDVWAVEPDTGQRVGDEPHATFELGPDGEFGPLVVESGAPYEWLLSTDDSPVQHHLYLQSYVRSSALVRLLSSAPDGTTRANTNVGEDHTALVVIRMREWYAEDDGDLPGDQRDVLEVGGDGTAPVDVLTDAVGNGAIGLHLHDDAATPGETTLAPLPYFSTQPFQSGVDVFLPASPDAGGTITVRNVPRGDADRPQVLNVPNWPSSDHSVSVVFSDAPLG
jgi:pimeloyl-ACP methyl ester carboxylesterase